MELGRVYRPGIIIAWAQSSIGTCHLTMSSVKNCVNRPRVISFLGLTEIDDQKLHTRTSVCCAIQRRACHQVAVTPAHGCILTAHCYMLRQNKTALIYIYMDTLSFRRIFRRSTILSSESRHVAISLFRCVIKMDWTPLIEHTEKSMCLCPELNVKPGKIYMKMARHDSNVLNHPSFFQWHHWF